MITSQLKLCGETMKDEDMLKKTFTTFHVSNVILQQQYHEKSLRKYSELTSCLILNTKKKMHFDPVVVLNHFVLVVEKFNVISMKNREALTRATPLSEAYMVEA